MSNLITHEGLLRVDSWAEVTDDGDEVVVDVPLAGGSWVRRYEADGNELHLVDGEGLGVEFAREQGKTQAYAVPVETSWNPHHNQPLRVPLRLIVER